MSYDRSLNDALLHPFLMAEGFVESQNQLMILLSNHAEPRIRSIVIHRLRSNPRNHDFQPDYEDVFSEAKTRLLTYLKDLKDNLTGPCKDFLSYVAAIAHRACHDYFRQRYPLRAKLYKRIRDILHTNPEFAMWKPPDKPLGYWLCGLTRWQERPNSSESLTQSLLDNIGGLTEALSALGDIQLISTSDLLLAIFESAGEPIRVADLVDLVAELQGIRDVPAVSFDANQSGKWRNLSDSRLRIDSILEMREPLNRFWQALCALPRDEFKAYLLYARDASGEDMITLLIRARIADEREMATMLEMPLDRFRDMWVNDLPLENERIASELGAKIEPCIQTPLSSGEAPRKAARTAAPEQKIIALMRKNSRGSPS